MFKKNIDRPGNNSFAIFFITVLSFVFICEISSLVIKGIHYMAREEKKWDASIYYPFEEDDESEEENLILVNLFNRLENLKDMLEEETTSFFYFRMPFILVKKTCDRIAGLDMTTSLCAGENNLQDSSDVVLTYEGDCLGFIMDDADISEELEQLVKFGEQMKREGRDFLFFLNPEKFKGNEVYQDYSEKKKKEIVEAFETHELDICVFPYDVKEKDIVPLFFKTDHHWLPSAGIWADKILCDTLNKNYGYCFDLSIFDEDNYSVHLLENNFLGSQGKKVTEVYCQKEDFPIIIPKYDTDLQVFISEKGKLSYGTIEDTLFDYSIFNKQDSYVRNDYTFYGYGDQELIKIHNNHINDGSNILIIKTSFADCMYPYLAAVVENLSIIDLRYFGGSLQAYIEDINPDTVIIIYGVGTFEDNKVIFDFR